VLIFEIEVVEVGMLATLPEKFSNCCRENFPKLDFIVECTIVKNTKSYTEVAQLPTDQIDEGGILSGGRLWLLMFIGGCIAAGMVIKYQKSHLHEDKIL